MSKVECHHCGRSSEREVRRRVGRKGQVVVSIHCRGCGRWLMPATESMTAGLPVVQPGPGTTLKMATVAP